MQKRLIPKTKIDYSYGSYNKIKNNRQWIRLSQGCPHNCPYCYEPTEYEIYDIPKIEKNNVGIIDMNLLCQPAIHNVLRTLGLQRVDNKVVYYELVCGLDYRHLTQPIADQW